MKRNWWWVLGLLSVMESGFAHGQDVTSASVPPANSYRAQDTLHLELEHSEDPDIRDEQECLAGLSWAPSPFQVSITDASENHANFHVRFPSPRPCGDEQVDQVICEWYACLEEGEAKAIAKRPAVVVVHESGSDMVVGRLIATELRRVGVHAFLVQLPGYGERQSHNYSPDNLIQVFAQGVADVRRARDAVAAIPEVDTKHIAIQGTSLGGFVATLAASFDARFDSTFLLLCGGDLHGVLTTGTKDAKKTLRKLLASGVREEELPKALHAIEPLRVAHRIPAKSTWLYSGMFDQVVPPKHAKLLAQEIGLPADHHIHLLANHYSGIVYLSGIIQQIKNTVSSTNALR